MLLIIFICIYRSVSNSKTKVLRQGVGEFDVFEERHMGYADKEEKTFKRKFTDYFRKK